MQVCALMKRDGFQLAEICHDNDSATMAIAREEFPGVQEKMDIGHSSKNLRQKVIDMAKVENFDAIRGFGERVRRDFIFLVHKYTKDAKTMKEKLANMPNHYAGKHDKCDHDASFEPRYSPIEHQATLDRLLQVLQPYIDNAEKYAGRSCSNVCEGFNQSLTVEAPKRIDYRRSYAQRVNLTALRKNNGHSGAQAAVMEQVGFKPSRFTTASLAVRDRARALDARRKRKQKYRQARAAKKKQKYARGARVSNPDNVYKGLTGGEPVEERDEASRPKRKAPEAEAGAGSSKKRKRCSGCGSTDGHNISTCPSIAPEERERRRQAKAAKLQLKKFRSDSKVLESDDWLAGCC